MACPCRCQLLCQCRSRCQCLCLNLFSVPLLLIAIDGAIADVRSQLLNSLLLSLLLLLLLLLLYLLPPIDARTGCSDCRQSAASRCVGACVCSCSCSCSYLSITTATSTAIASALIATLHKSLPPINAWLVDVAVGTIVVVVVVVATATLVQRSPQLRPRHPRSAPPMIGASDDRCLRSLNKIHKKRQKRISACADRELNPGLRYGLSTIG
jgi:hypothetical protein